LNAYLRDELDLKDPPPPFADTATLAAQPWLAQLPDDLLINTKSGDWNGQWLHWPRRDADSEEDACPDDVWGKIRDAKKTLGPPPSYYAVLMLDGDNMGDWLAGQNSPAIRAAIHPDMVKYFEKLRDTKPGLDAKRPVSPSLHGAISEALGNFAQYVAPAIVAEHQGELIYAGGDDVLALLPTQTVLACANALKRAFRGEVGCNAGAPEGFYRVEGRGDLLVMGTKATASVGIAVVHYKEDLRAALEMAREAERAAKKEGKDRVSLTVARRSGEHASATVPWALVSELAKAVKAFAAASDRWAYRMREVLPVFAEGGPPEEAFKAELQRQLDRAEDEATRKLPVAKFYDDLRNCSDEKEWHVTATRLITLWQSASFLARGRDVAGRT
jgi:CRISPR-associated protein Cmr2